MWLNKTTKVCEQDSSVLFDISIIPPLSLSPSLLPSYHSSLLPSFSLLPPSSPPPLLPSLAPSLTHSLTPSLSFLPPFLTLPPTLIQKTNKQKKSSQTIIIIITTTTVVLPSPSSSSSHSALQRCSPVRDGSPGAPLAPAACLHGGPSSDGRRCGALQGVGQAEGTRQSAYCNTLQGIIRNKLYELFSQLTGWLRQAWWLPFLDARGSPPATEQDQPSHEQLPDIPHRPAALGYNIRATFHMYRLV